MKSIFIEHNNIFFLNSVSGTRQTPIEAKLFKDGKPLPNKEIEAVVEQEKVLFKVKKPTREGSGKYEIKLSNAQGEDSKEVNIIMQSAPSVPQNVEVVEVFQTNCTVTWKTPQDDGGSPILKYIIERQVRQLKRVIPFGRYIFIRSKLLIFFYKFLRTYHLKQRGITLVKWLMESRRNIRLRTSSLRRHTSLEFEQLIRLVPVNLDFSLNLFWLKILGVCLLNK